MNKIHKKNDDPSQQSRYTAFTMSFSVRRLDDRHERKSKWKSALMLLLAATRPVLTVAHIWKEKQEEKRKEAERENLLKRVAVILVTVLCGFVLFAGTTKALLSLNVLNIGSLIDTVGSELPTDTHGHINVLLLGQGDSDHDGVDLTDTVMIASIDPATDSAVLLSLPRDLYFLETEKMGKGRLNSLYRDYKIVLKRNGMEEAEASELAMRELANEIGIALNIELHHIVKVDFIGFVQAVDALGGIDIVVPETLVDTEYPGPNYTYETFTIQGGPQHIDGETALKYARSRHSTSDFDRSARQQQILQAIADKVREEGILTKPGQIMDLLGIMKEHVETTLQVRDMVALAGIGRDIDRSKMITMQLNSQNGLYGEFSSPGGLLYNPPRDLFGGAAVLLPVSIPEDPVTWDRIRLLTELLVHMRTPYMEDAPILIRNAGAVEGSGRRLGGELIRFGFNVADIGNSENDTEQERSTIQGPEDSETAKLLASLLGLDFIPLPKLVSSQASSIALPPQPITITLGSLYEYNPFPDDPLTPQ